MSENKNTLEYLRTPFEAHQIGKLPKPTSQQTKDAKAPKWDGVKCEICGAWHHPKVVHLDYVGHAALTDRFLDVDSDWTWEPLAFKEGLPAFDSTGGLWIKLTILGVTRIGYGHAASSEYKEIGSREKEVIGDALRNAGMRFGCALDLWHKGDLHLDDDNLEPAPKNVKKTFFTLPLPEAMSYLETWKRWIDEGFVEGLSIEVKDHIKKVSANKAVKDYYNTKLNEGKK